MTDAVLHTLFLFLEKQKLSMIQAQCNGNAAKQTSDLSSFQKLIFVQPFLVKLCDHFPHVEIGIIFHLILSQSGPEKEFLIVCPPSSLSCKVQTCKPRTKELRRKILDRRTDRAWKERICQVPSVFHLTD